VEDRDEQLEIRFHGDVAEIKASGAWKPVIESMTRRQLLKVAGMTAGGAFLVSLAGACGQSQAPETSGSTAGGVGAGKTIALSIEGTTEYVIYSITGALETLKGTEYKHVVRQAAFDPQRELANIESFVTQQVDALTISPVTTASASRGALKAQAAGIPVANQLWIAPTPADEAYTAVVHIDNNEGGKMIADWLMEQLPGGGDIVVVTGTPGQGFTQQLNDGLIAALQPGWQVVAAASGKYVRSTTIDVTQTMLTAHPDAKAIVTHSSGMGAATASYLATHKLDNILHVTSDVNWEMVQWMVKGYVHASRYFSPAQNDIIAVGALRDYLENGKKPDPFQIKQPHQMVTKEDLSGSPPPRGIFNPKLEPASGVYAYMEFLPEAEKV